MITYWRTARMRYAGVLAAAACVSLAYADRWDDAIALLPADAHSALVVPSPKQASDDLQQGIERMGRDEIALGGRPVDLLRAQLGIGAGFDDKGMLVAWGCVPPDGATDAGAFKPTEWCALIPVTDAKVFIESSLKPEGPALPEQAYTFAAGGPPVYVRSLDKHVLVGSSAARVKAYEKSATVGADLVKRLGERGTKVARSGDVLIWLGQTAMKRYAAQTLAEAKALATAAEGDEAGEFARVYIERSREIAERTAKIVSQISDTVFTADLDAMGVGVRGFVRFDPASELGKRDDAAPPARGLAPATDPAPQAVTSLLDRLPGAPFYFAAGVDVRGMGGLSRLRTMLSAMPMGERIPIPEWLDAVQDKIDGLQVALYPSKLAIASGGMLNDASLVIRTTDAAGVRNALKTWVNAQQGEREGMKTEATWEDARELKAGGTAAAFSVKEVALEMEAGGGPMQRLLRQIIVGQRGLHGFAVEIPDGLVVTFSQRTDVLERALAAAKSGGTGTLGTQAALRSYAPWLMPKPGFVAFLGLNELIGAAHQIAKGFPGGAGLSLPMPSGPVEPVAFGASMGDGAWEAALVVPSSALALGFDAMRQRAVTPGGEELPDQGAPSAPAPAAPTP